MAGTEPGPLVTLSTPERPAPQEVRGRFLVETWGCQMNVYDSERFAGELRRLGYQATDDERLADVIVLNTCSVRESAEEKLFSRLGRLRPIKQERPWLIVGVAGCVAQQERERVLDRSPVVDFVMGTGAIRELGRLVEGARDGLRGVATEIHDEILDEVRPIERSVPHRAYVTIVEGCNKSCSFCVVPYTRGPERNRAPDALLTEIREASDQGAIEVELLGQNVNAYRHGEVGFGDLLRQVDRVSGIRRIRFRTSHPRELTASMIAAMAETDHVCRQLHLPVQSGSSEVLRHMARGYDRERYLARIAALRVAIPDIALSTDIIVGFPGETEAEFLETMTLLAEVAYDQVFGFVYSPRPHTRAASLPDPEPRAAKEDRLRRLFELQDAISRRKHEGLVGREVEVLVDGRAKRGDGCYTGRSEDGRVVNFFADCDPTGTLVTVRVTQAFPHSLLAEPIPHASLI